jgi:parvulin-like peptidyl-prolyl isomerase
MAFCAAIATAVTVGACGSGIPGNAVAVVGSAPITKAAFEHWEVVANDSTQPTTGAAALPLPVPPDYTACIAGYKKQPATASDTASALKSLCKQTYTGLVGEVMDYLVEALWIEGAAVDHGVKVTQAQVLKAYSQQRKSSTVSLKTNAELNKFLAASGETVADLLWRTKLNLLALAIQTKVEKAVSKVTPAAIAAYYKKNRAQFVTPETVDLHLIETSDAATATKVRALLASGQTYAQLAPKYSKDPTTKAAGGAANGVRPGELTSLLNAAVFAAKVGVLSQPVQTPFGYYIFTVDSITPQKVVSLKAATATIKAAISAANESKANAALDKEFTTKWVGITKCATGYIVASACSNAPKTTSTGATGATSG